MSQTESGASVFLAILLMPILSIWHGIILKITWGWFMVPIFGLPRLGLFEALGVALVIGYITSNYAEDNRPLLTKAYEGFLKGLFVLVFGFIYKSFA